MFHKELRPQVSAMIVWCIAQVWDIATCEYEGNLYHDPKVQDTKNPSLHNHGGKLINHMVVSADGRYLLCGATDKTASLWDLEDEALVHTFAGHSGSVRKHSLLNDSVGLLPLHRSQFS